MIFLVLNKNLKSVNVEFYLFLMLYLKFFKISVDANNRYIDIVEKI